MKQTSIALILLASIWATQSVGEDSNQTIVIGGDFEMLLDVDPNWIAVDRNADSNSLTATLANGSEANFVVHAEASADIAVFNNVLSVLGETQQPTTYLMFVGEAADPDWVESLVVPSNVHVGYAVRALDTAEVAHVYQDYGVDYDGTGVRYDVMAAVKLASDAADSGQLNRVPNAGQITTLGFFDQGIVISGASDANAATLLEIYQPEQIRVDAEWKAERGFNYVPTANGVVSNDIEVVANHLLANECDTLDWFDRIENEVAFQSFPRLGSGN